MVGSPKSVGSGGINLDALFRHNLRRRARGDRADHLGDVAMKKAQRDASLTRIREQITRLRHLIAVGAAFADDGKQAQMKFWVSQLDALWVQLKALDET